MARTRLYRSGNLVLDDIPVDDISEHLADPSSVLWLDLYRPAPAEFAMIGQEFGIHQLAHEDTRHQGQRPKLDRYRTHEFLSAYAVSNAADSAELSTHEIAVFLTPRR
jgi:magnesium transporter